MNRNDAPVVWSSDGNNDDNKKLRNKLRKKKHKPQAAAPKDPRDGVVRVRRETSGRGGKTVSTITGLSGDIDGIAKQLKQHCGTGGNVKNSVVEIQGDHVDTLMTWLSAQGHTVKRAGG